jgi:hypothetical protein
MSEREQPDPGEGWRLLVEGETIEAGDEFIFYFGGHELSIDWLDAATESENIGKKFSRSVYMPHRRRSYIDAPQPDLVNAPPHYRQGGIECIDAIRAALTDEEFRGYVKGNAIKYTWREKHKGGDQDLKKAAWYLNRIETIKTETAK